MPSVADVAAVMDQLYDPALAEPWDAIGLVCGDPEAEVERVMFGTDRYILPANTPASSAGLANQETLQCVDCDVRWVSEQGAPHRCCWSCGEPGRPARANARRRVP